MGMNPLPVAKAPDAVMKLDRRMSMSEPRASRELRLPIARRASIGSRSPGAALSISTVPPSAPGPHRALPPPRVTRIRPIRSVAMAGKLIQPPNGSAWGTPSRMSSARLEALPPRPRSVIDWLVALAERESERRKPCRPATSRSTSSSRPLADWRMRARSIVAMSWAAAALGGGRPRPVTMIGSPSGGAPATSGEAADNRAAIETLARTGGMLGIHTLWMAAECREATGLQQDFLRKINTASPPSC